MRSLPLSFNSLLSSDYASLDLYPSHLRDKIDRISDWMQRDLNTGVYKAGFAPDQETYDQNVIPVFAALNRLEDIIHQNGGPFLLGEELTELDIRLFTTAIRFDTVYHQHFKCNLGSIRHDYPNMNNWMKNLYWNVKGFKESTDFRHIKENVCTGMKKFRPRLILNSTPRATMTSIRNQSHQRGLFRTWKTDLNPILPS
jgi:putative glutathione S-transferase